MINKLLDAAMPVLFFAIAFASFGILAGAFASAPVAAIAGKTTGLIVGNIVAAYVAFRCTKAAMEIV
jgi:hypothetical protein